MKFAAKHKSQLLTSAFKCSEKAKKADKFTPELRAAIENLCCTVRDKSESFPIQWIDQDGQFGERTLGPMSAIKMLDGLTEVLGMVQSSAFWQKFESSLELALLMADSVEGIGPSRAMAFKSLLDGCSREDAVTIHIMQTVFADGVKAWGDKPWERSSGHTVWTPVEVVNTIVMLYKFPEAKARELAKFLRDKAYIGVYGGLLALPKIYAIESRIRQFASSTYDEGALGYDLDGLTQEQCELLRGISASESKIICVKGPGGTGKTHTIARHIKALIESGETVLCCAPTGIAAKVLNDSLKASGVDTAQLVCGSVVVLDRAIALAKFGQLDADHLVIDEGSMTSVEHLSVLGLLSGLKRLIMLGDPSQLRPVEAGQPFMDMLGLEGVTVLRLYTNMRANGEKLAGELAQVRSLQGVIHQIIPMAKSSYTKDHGDLRASPQTALSLDMRTQLHKWIQSSVGRGYVWLAHSNAVCEGLANLNLAILHGFSENDLDNYTSKLIAAYFGARLNRKAPKVSMEIEGLKVYWTGDRDGDEERVYRGFTGTVGPGGIVSMEAITREGNMTRVEYALEQIENKLMPWMVKTVHKSQGQSLENVVYLIKAGMGGRHSAELAYTAHSRAKNDCIVVSLCNEKRNPKLTPDPKRRTSLGNFENE